MEYLASIKRSERELSMKNNINWWILKIGYLIAETLQMIIVTIILGYIVGKLGNSANMSQFILILKNCGEWIAFYLGLGIFKILMDYRLKNLDK